MSENTDLKNNNTPPVEGNDPPVDEVTENPTPSQNDASDGTDNASNEAEDTPEEAEDIRPRLERLGGEPAPDITPEEFARLQQNGQIHIDPRGRVRAAQTGNTDAGVSLRKRRAWYGG